MVSLSQNMFSPECYEDGIDNVKNQGNTVNKAEVRAKKSTGNKARSHRDPPNRSRATELMQTRKTSCSAGIYFLALNSKQFLMPL